MGYRKAEEILPMEVIEIIQRYVDGENIYIPRIQENRKQWGSQTSFQVEMMERNHNIYQDYLKGEKSSTLARKYFLSEKSIQRIVRDMKKVS